MKINRPKIQILVGNPNEESTPDITLEGDTLKIVNEYKYLESMITNDAPKK